MEKEVRIQILTELSNPDYCSVKEEDDLIIGDGAIVVDVEVAKEEPIFDV